MSRILRRPMFRGGKVDSRGTGITTGLDQPRIGAANGRFISGAELLSAAQSFPQLNMFRNMKFNPKSKYILGQDEDIDRIASFAGEGMSPGFQDLAFADTFNISAPEDTTPKFEKIASASSTTPIVEEKSTLSEMDDYSFTPTQKTEEKSGILDLSKGKETETVKVEDDEPEVTMTDLEKALGLDRARQEYAADALAAASKAFFEGKGFGAIADAAAVKSKAPDIKRLAAIEEFKADRAEKLFDKKTDALLKQKEGTKGAFQKKLDTILKQPEGTQGHKIALIENKLQPTIQGQIASETVDNNYTRPSAAEIIGYMDLYYPQSYVGTVSATEEMAGKKAGTYITEDATTIIFWDGKNARAQSI